MPTGDVASWAMTRADAEDHMRVFIPWADIVVIEKLTITANSHKKSRELQPSIELVGVAKHYARLFEKEVIEQMPSEVMKFASNDKLKRLGWYVPGPDHQNDARRHLLTVIVDREYIDRRTILRPEGGD
jgi:hypothetical protein